MIIHTNVRAETNKENVTETPQIIFLNYSVKLNKSNGEYEILLINKFIAEGKLKMNNSEPEIPKPGDLKCIALDNRMAPVDSITITDPLNITVESVDENNALFKREIARDSAQFSIRMQLNKNTDAIAIKKNANSKVKNPYLLITKIKKQ
jgi:hypothetical protein